MMDSHRSQRIEMLSRNGYCEVWQGVRSEGVGVSRNACVPLPFTTHPLPIHSVDLGKIALLRCRNFQPGLGLGSG